MDMEQTRITGSEALIRSLIAEGVDTVFGYPGGQIINTYDKLFDYRHQLKHILVRHEQGATHAAQGYARVSGKPGVVIVTSGPGVTNTITGIADAMLDSTPLVVISGQVASPALGTDAFQEVDVIGISQPITKWSYQIRNAEEIPEIISKAFYIARSGRPGPVVIDLSKDAQVGMMDFSYERCDFIRSFFPYPEIKMHRIEEAARLINEAKKPLLIFGQGVILANAEKELLAFAEKGNIPMAATVLGLTAVPYTHPLFKGMLGMHGNVAPNMKTNECDVLIAVGMRFDDRVTGDLNTYAKQAKVIHLDIDKAEINKNVHADVPVAGDAKQTLPLLTERIETNTHSEWIASFDEYVNIEKKKVIDKEIYPTEGPIKMGEVVRKVSEATKGEGVLVTDVGQNQMMGIRYFKTFFSRGIVTSGGLGTMGFGLPAAIGAKIGAPERTICLFVGDGGLQMTIQEFGTILQYGVDVKIILLNNNYLGMVRQWQELFFNQRYSETVLRNPDFVAIASAYGIMGEIITAREQLDGAIQRMMEHKGSYFLDVRVEHKGMVYPMVPAGACITNILLEKENDGK